MKNVRADIEEQKQETDDSTINSDDVTDKNPSKDSTSDELEDKGTDNVDQKIQAAKETDTNIVVNKESAHLMDLIIPTYRRAS